MPTTKNARLTGEQLKARTNAQRIGRRDMTYRELAAYYCASVPPNEPRDHRLKKWLELYGARDAWALTTDDFQGVLDALRDEGYAASTINREQGDQSAIYSLAIKRRIAPTGFANPLTGIERLPEEMRRVHLSDAKIDRLLALAKASSYGRMYGLILTAITSGARKNELLRMTWARTDLESGRAEIGTDRKSRQYRVLMLTPAVADELRTYKQHSPDAKVFCRRHDPFMPYDPRKVWTNLRKQIGEEHLHFHDLRHVATQRLLRSGVNLHTTSRVLGHKDSRMVARRYGALEATDIHAAVVAASGALGQSGARQKEA